VADRYISDRTRGGRRPGKNVTQLAGIWAPRAAIPNGGKLYTVSVAADRIRSSVPIDQMESQQLREMLKRCVVQVPSQKRTRRMLKINLMKTIDGDSRR
jgi:ribosomal protein L28